MQEIKKRRIVLASVLKPADEPRMYERMGRSLAINGYEVYIIGTTATSESTLPGIQFITHSNIRRLSLPRFLIRLKIIKEILSIRPDILVVSTHELLGVAIIYKLLTGKKVVYDVQENYAANIIHASSLHPALRHLLAFFIRLKELTTSFFISHFLLAEKCYANELPFISNRFTVIENKCQVPDYFHRKTSSDYIQLLFTGTLGQSTGIFKAISFAKGLHGVNPKIKLLIIGYGAEPTTIQQIRNEISDQTFIELIGGDQFVSHQKIIDAILTSHFGLICYPLAPHIENKIPSKLYEYLSLQLPIIIENHKPWRSLCESVQAAIAIDFDNFDATQVMNEMSEKKFYSALPEETTWRSEEEKFMNTINSLL